MRNMKIIFIVILGLMIGALTPFIASAQDHDKSYAEEVYVGPFERDKYYMFSSGGQSGGIFVFGLPSGRLFMDLPVFEPRAAYAYAQKGTEERKRLEETGGLWGDTHHPRLSWTNGDVDGKWLYIQDKAHTRVAKIDLRTFRTVLIKNVPNQQTVHGTSLVPDEKGNTKYLCANGEFEAPIPLKKGLPGGYTEKEIPEVGTAVPGDWKNAVTCLDAETLEPVFQILSDYGNFDIQDASDDGRWIASSIYNFERGSNIVEMIKKREDAVQFLHIPTAERALEEGKYKLVNGVKVLDPKEIKGLIYILPAMKNPHGVHFSRPGTKWLIAAGKLAPVVNIYDVSGSVPKLVAQPEICLGSLHVQYDGRGNAYVSCFIDSQIVAFNIENAVKFPNEPEKYIIDRLDIHYNVGHLSAVKNYSKPVGDYLVAQNKLTKGILGFLPTGPMEPEVQELIDIRGITADGKGKMKLMYQFPSPPEPHESDFIEADRLAPMVWSKYKKPFDDVEPVKMGDSRVVRTGPKSVHVYLTAIRSRFGLDEIRVRQGDEVTLTLTNIERIRDMTHGFGLTNYGLHYALDPGDTKVAKFVADKPGVYWYYCTWFCSALHMEMRGRFIVEPVP